MRHAIHLVVASTLGAIVAGCACGNAFERDAAGDADAAVDATTLDAGSAATDAAVCRLAQPPTCTSDADCLAWGASVAPPGTYPVTRCEMGFRLPPNTGICGNGVLDCNGNTVDTCGCNSTTYCHAGFVCVSDTPGGPTRCAQQCEGR